MRYIHFYGSAGYCGTGYHDFQAFEDDIKDCELDEISQGMAYDCAETYSYLHTGWDEDFESEEDERQYHDDAMGHCGWKELSKEDWEILEEKYT